MNINIMAHTLVIYLFWLPLSGAGKIEFNQSFTAKAQ